MATFKRAMFNSETNYVKANFLNGHNPVVDSANLEHITDVSGNLLNLKFNDKLANISYLYVSNSTDLEFFTKNTTQIFDLDFTKFKPYTFRITGATSIRKFININTKLPLESFMNGSRNYELIHFKKFNNNNNINWLCYGSNGNTFICDDASLISFVYTNKNSLPFASSNINRLELYGYCKLGLNLEASTSMARENIVKLFQSLGTVTDGNQYYIYLGSTLLAKLTDEDKKIATDKGWTLA